MRSAGPAKGKVWGCFRAVSGRTVGLDRAFASGKQDFLPAVMVALVLGGCDRSEAPGDRAVPYVNLLYALDLTRPYSPPHPRYEPSQRRVSLGRSDTPGSTLHMFGLQ